MDAPFLQDQAGFTFTFAGLAERIVSLVPSQTELLFGLGAGHRVVGITKFCIFPAGSVRSVPKVGGTKKVHLKKVQELKPDLIIGNKEENQQHEIEALQQLCPVWLSYVQDFPSACQMITSIGKLSGKTQSALQLVNQLTAEHQALTSLATPPVPTLYLIWKKPWMLAGKGTFIDAMMQYAGLQNCTGATRYPIMEDPESLPISPQVVLLSSEPYPFQAKHLAEVKALFPRAVVFLVDGTYFSWYGSRMLAGFRYLAALRQSVLKVLESAK